MINNCFFRLQDSAMCASQEEVSFSHIRASASWSVRLPLSPMMTLAPLSPLRPSSSIPAAAPSSPIPAADPSPHAAAPAPPAALPVRQYDVDLDATAEVQDVEVQLRRCQERLKEAEAREAKLEEDNRGLIESLRNITQSNLLLASQVTTSQQHNKETLVHLECSQNGIRRVRLTRMDDLGGCSDSCSHLKLYHSGIVKCVRL